MSNMLHSGREKKRIQHRSTAKTLAFALSYVGSGGQSVAAAFDDKDNQQIISNTLHNNNTTPALRSLAPLKQLVTTYESQSASAGMMFDIKTKNSIIIRGLDINTARRGYTQLEIYTKTGSHKMNGRPTMNENVWKLWMNDTIDAKGKDNPTRIPPSIFAPITVPEDQIRSFYVTFTDGPHLRYNNEGLTRFVSDDVIIFGQGSAKRIGWDGAILSPRTFSGGLYYEVMTKGNNFGDNDEEEFPLLSVPTPRPNTVRPTPRPRTTRPSKSPTPRPTPLPTPEIVPQMIVGSFRLRLYWEEGYRWQETSREMVSRELSLLLLAHLDDINFTHRFPHSGTAWKLTRLKKVRRLRSNVVERPLGNNGYRMATHLVHNAIQVYA